MIATLGKTLQTATISDFEFSDSSVSAIASAHGPHHFLEKGIDRQLRFSALILEDVARLYRSILQAELNQASQSLFLEAVETLGHWFLVQPPARVSLPGNEAAVLLIDSWLKDDSGYDEEIWPKLRESIELNRLSDRPRFND